MRVEEVTRVVNASDLSYQSRPFVERNEVAECILRLDSPVAFDIHGCENTNRFVIVDDYEIAGGGIITEAMAAEDFDERNIRWRAGYIDAMARQRLLGHKGMIVWMTGLSGAGKSSIAEVVEGMLYKEGVASYILDGDKLRSGLNSDLGFSEADREENIRRAATVAALFEDAGIVTIVTLISPYRHSRRMARTMSRHEFMEVYVKASVNTCIDRDPKGLYHKAMKGEIMDFTGITSPYEEPISPDLVLDTELWDEEECAENLFNAIMARIH